MGKAVDLYPEMNPEERIEALARVAIRDKAHLKRWLQASGRQWLVFNALDLVDALPWPDGIDLFMQVVARYRNHRASIDTGRTKMEQNPTTGEDVEVSIFKGETLEVEELDLVIRYLVDQIHEKDSLWTFIGKKPM